MALFRAMFLILCIKSYGTVFLRLSLWFGGLTNIIMIRVQKRSMLNVVSLLGD
jgi:hypothetical protein